MREIRMKKRAAALLLVLVSVIGYGCERSAIQQIAKNGPEVWWVDGRAHRIASTHYEHGPHDTVLYVVGFRVAAESDLFGADEQTARTLAWPILRYAYEHRSYERVRIRAFRGMLAPIVRIAVDLLPPLGSGQDKPGYRVVLSIGEIVSCLNRGESCKRP
jgi:hypothetical protein